MSRVHKLHEATLLPTEVQSTSDGQGAEISLDGLVQHQRPGIARARVGLKRHIPLLAWNLRDARYQTSVPRTPLTITTFW